MARWKAHVRFSISVNWTIFAIYRGSGVMRRNVYSLAVFTGVDLFALNFYLVKFVPHQPFLAPENRRHWTTRWQRLYPSASLHFDIIPECDRQVDRQTDMPPTALYTGCKASFAVCCNKIVNKSSRVNFNGNKNNTHWPSYVRITITNY